MKAYTIYYKDHIGRSNQASSAGSDETDARRRFAILYPDCTITKVE